MSRAQAVEQSQYSGSGVDEVGKMAKTWDMTRIVFLGALAVALCLGASCKKAETPPPDTSGQTAAPQKGEPAPAQPVVQPVAATPQQPAEAPKPAPATAETSDVKLVPLNIELPRPMFVGTPQETKVENLEKPLGKPRPPFLAPEGTINLARGKPVTSSDEEPIIGEIKMITDGDKEAADGCYVELGPRLQYVTIDLEKQCELYAIVLWHYHKQARVYYDVIVQVSNDPDFVSDVKTVFNNDIDNSAGLGIGRDMHYTETAEGKLIDLYSQGSPRARYVRLYSNGNTSNDLNHYIEVDVYGKPVE
jgi:hypothetical protein